MNMFWNMNSHSTSKYSVIFSIPIRHGFHFAMRAFATLVMGKNMLKIVANTTQYSRQCPTYEVMAFLLKSGHFGSKLLVIALNVSISTILYGSQCIAIHFAIVHLI